ncbi:MAG: ribonuclease P protein component [Planctomycetaceae bacterium]|jgi:ribonuclease P protein component|nr:ribonuclease P protein component [Planctomycetaceae bacterium]
MTNHFPKSSRLRNSGQFQNVFALRRSVADHAIILFAAPNELSHCRLGLSVSKKIGNAVVRNRWKRLTREAFRTSQSELPSGLDLVVIPQRNVDVRTIQHLEQSLKNLAAKIAKRTARKKPTVLLTRPEHQTEPVKSQLETLGFHVLLQPVIDILPPESWHEMDEAIQNIRSGQFDWLIFSSSNGVHSFFDRLGQVSVADVRIAVVGNSTNDTLYQRMGRNADIVPETFTAEGVVAALFAEATQGKRFLHLRASRGRDTIRQLLTESGGSVTEIAAYRSVDRIHADPQMTELLQRGSIDFVTVTSSAIARSLTAMFGELLRQTSLVSISPITSQTLCDLGFPPQKEADEASLDGIVRVLHHLIRPFN